MKRELFKNSNVKFIIFVVILFLLVGIISLSSFSSHIDKATVERVVDGDTIIVCLNDKQEKVRFLGIDAPESVNPNRSANSKAGKEASNFLKKQLTNGQTIYLEDDPWQDKKDKYKRLLRYVWITEPNENIENMVNYQIIKNGHANVNFYGNNTAKYKKELCEAESIYKTENLDVEYVDAQI